MQNALFLEPEPVAAANCSRPLFFQRPVNDDAIMAIDPSQWLTGVLPKKAGQTLDANASRRSYS
jgi:hypothetical protein